VKTKRNTASSALEIGQSQVLKEMQNTVNK